MRGAARYCTGFDLADDLEMSNVRKLAVRCPAVVLCVALAMTAAACSGGGKAKTAATVAPGDAPTQVTIKIPGTEPVVLVLNAANAGDAIELARLTGYSAKACSTSGANGSPACRDEEKDGTDVQVLAAMACDRSWIRPESVPDAYKSALSEGAKLIALYKPKRGAGAVGADLSVEYVLVMQSGNRNDGTADGAALHIRDGRVVMIETPCAGFLQLINADRIDSYVVNPTPTGELTAE